MSESFDPKRRLCPDGACIGVIGPDGRCGVCGRSASGRPGVLAGGAGGATNQLNNDANDDDHDDGADDEAQAAPAEGSGFDPNRRLCDDGSCVGVVGPDGRCGVCGKEVAA
jgi:hypothetical protein